MQNVNLLKIPVVFINLDKEINKKQLMEKLLLGLGFKNIKRIDAVSADFIDQNTKYHETSYATACSSSFIKALESAHAPFLLLEDDIEINNFQSNIKIPRDADIVYLGGTRYGINGLKDSVGTDKTMFYQKTKDSNIVIPKGMLGGHAILILNENAREKMISEIKKNINTIQDMTFARMQIKKMCKFYAINPPLFYQYEQENATINPFYYNEAGTNE
jgi:hypothetical protein